MVSLRTQFGFTAQHSGWKGFDLTRLVATEPYATKIHSWRLSLLTALALL